MPAGSASSATDETTPQLPAGGTAQSQVIEDAGLIPSVALRCIYHYTNLGGALQVFLCRSLPSLQACVLYTWTTPMHCQIFPSQISLLVPPDPSEPVRRVLDDVSVILLTPLLCIARAPGHKCAQRSLVTTSLFTLITTFQNIAQDDD